MTPRRKANHVPHFLDHPKFARWKNNRALGRVAFQLDFRHIRRCVASCPDTGQLRARGSRGRDCATSRRTRSISQFVLRMSGGVPCMEHCRDVLPRRAKSNDKFGRALTKLSASENLESLPRLYGRSIQQPALPRSLEKTSERGRVGSQANSNHQASCSRPF